jgi:hypothetical protein
MGMFDTYFPRPALSCPRCGAPVEDFQGKDGPRGLFVWLQGMAAPSDQVADDDCKLPVEQREAFRLPDRFVIYTHCSVCKLRVEATGFCDQGVWTRCVLGPL